MDTFLKFIHMTISYFIYTRKIPLLSISDSMFSDKNRSHFFSFLQIYTVDITLAFYIRKKSLGTIKKINKLFLKNEGVVEESSLPRVACLYCTAASGEITQLPTHYPGINILLISGYTSGFLVDCWLLEVCLLPDNVHKN